MFGLGVWELIIILVFLFVLVAGVAGAIILISALSKSRNPSPRNSQSERLKELQKMKDNGLITEDEFNKKRNGILNNL